MKELQVNNETMKHLIKLRAIASNDLQFDNFPFHDETFYETRWSSTPLFQS